MPDVYSERARDNILPLSQGKFFPAVFDEWRVTGQVKDYRDLVATCHLCEQERLRYHFEIANRFTRRTMWVGSSCILRFGVAVYEGSRRLTGKAVERKLASLIDQVRYDACLAALRALVRAERDTILENALDYLKNHGSLTPKFAFVVLWRLKEQGIDHSPSFFKINLRRQKYMRDMESMPASRVRMIWPALTAAQRKKAIRSSAESCVEGVLLG